MEFWHKFKHSQYISIKHDKSIWAAESKACKVLAWNGLGVECANQGPVWIQYIFSVLTCIYLKFEQHTSGEQTKIILNPNKAQDGLPAGQAYFHKI